MAWTPRQVEMLKALWIDGHSSSQIAKRIGGVTRNSVVGKISRMKESGDLSESLKVHTVKKTASKAGMKMNKYEVFGEVKTGVLMHIIKAQNSMAAQDHFLRAHPRGSVIAIGRKLRSGTLMYEIGSEKLVSLANRAVGCAS